MKNEQWGAWFKVKRQLDNSELQRYEDYCRKCREWWDFEPTNNPMNQEVWRVVNQGIKTV